MHRPSRTLSSRHRMILILADRVARVLKGLPASQMPRSSTCMQVADGSWLVESTLKTLLSLVTFSHHHIVR